MARYTGPTRKYSRRFGLLPDSEEKHTRGGRRRKLSDYGKGLEEKQKLKFIYGVLERQFRGYYEKSLQLEGNTEEFFVQMLETRLDNIIFRLGYANTRPQARQFVSHGHVYVDDVRVDVPSYQVKPGQIITLKKSTLELDDVKQNMEERRVTDLPDWIERKGTVGKMNRLPSLDDINLEVDVALIIEYYSR